MARLVAVFREVRRVLTDDGTLWLNLGDSYASNIKGSGGPDSSSTLVGTKAEHNGQRMRPIRLEHGLKTKDLIGIPWRVAFALQADGWWLRSDTIWSKPNPMPESVTDRPTKAHEYLFLLSKNGGRALLWRAADTGEWSRDPDLTERVTRRTIQGDEDIPRWRGFDYYYDASAIREPATDTGRVNGREGRNEDPGARPPGSSARTLARIDYTALGRNRRSVWTIPTQPYPEAHFATFPEALVEPCILAGSQTDDTVLDPFCGSGTVGVVALRHGRQFIGVELSPKYVEMARRRILGPLFAGEQVVSD